MLRTNFVIELDLVPRHINDTKTGSRYEAPQTRISSRHTSTSSRGFSGVDEPSSSIRYNRVSSVLNISRKQKLLSVERGQETDSVPGSRMGNHVLSSPENTHIEFSERTASKQQSYACQQRNPVTNISGLTKAMSVFISHAPTNSEKVYIKMSTHLS